MYVVSQLTIFFSFSILPLRFYEERQRKKIMIKIEIKKQKKKNTERKKNSTAAEIEGWEELSSCEESRACCD